MKIHLFGWMVMVRGYSFLKTTLKYNLKRKTRSSDTRVWQTSAYARVFGSRGYLSVLLLLCIFGFSPSLVLALESSIQFSISPNLAADGSPQFIQENKKDARDFSSPSWDQVKVGMGFQAKPSLMLGEAQYEPDAKTELLLHFDLPKPGDRNGAFESIGTHPDQPGLPLYQLIATNGVQANEKVKRFGSGAGVFNAPRDGLVYRAGPGSLFGENAVFGDFTIEFWLYPTIMKEGEKILEWQGLIRSGSQRIPQRFELGFYNRKLRWSFSNIFVDLQDLDSSLQEYRLENKRELLGRQWRHHMLRYDSRSGKLEYLINGVPEHIVYTTLSKREGSQVLQPYRGEVSDGLLKIGAGFTGFLDEIRVQRERVQNPQLESYAPRAGWFVLPFLDFRSLGAGSKLLRFDVNSRTPGKTGLSFSYQMSDVPLGGLRPEDGRWIPFSSGQEIKDKNQGKYLYILVELLPDGNGEQSPEFQGIKITYSPDPPPTAPGGLTIQPISGGLIVRWNRVADPDIQGYLLYYGTRPGQYFGEGARAGSSPIDVGAVTEFRLEGLTVGQIYYISIASYDRSNAPSEGLDQKRSFSREESARPAR